MHGDPKAEPEKSQVYESSVNTSMVWRQLSKEWARLHFKCEIQLAGWEQWTVQSGQISAWWLTLLMMIEELCVMIEIDDFIKNMRVTFGSTPNKAKCLGSLARIGQL